MLVKLEPTLYKDYEIYTIKARQIFVKHTTIDQFFSCSSVKKAKNYIDILVQLNK